jgi:hypothetical protein
MPLVPDPPFPKSRNDTIRSADWNALADEVIRLDGAKVDRAGDTISGSLTVGGTLGVGGPAGQRRIMAGAGDVNGIGLDGSDASPHAGYIRFGDNTGWQLHFGRSREASGGALNTGTAGVLATLQDNGNFGIGALAPRTALQVKTLTSVNEGPTAGGAWANFGSNVYYDGNWTRVDTTKAGVNLHMNGDGGGAEFRFARMEADGSNMRNLAYIGTGGTFITEGNLNVQQGSLNVQQGNVNVSNSAPGWKVSAGTSVTGGASALGVLSQTTSDTGQAFGGDFIANAGGANPVIGVWGSASGNGTGTKFGVIGSVGGTAGQQWAGWFAGNVNVGGTLSKGAGSFVIDHPLDPVHKILRHNLVESPENLCVYRGKATLDADGRATVEMPDYFPALTDEENATVHLTPVGEQPSPASYRWNDEHSAVTVFGAPNAEVAYLVLAARDDPVIHQLARPVEEDKTDENFGAGRLLYPEAFGHPEEMGVHFALRESIDAAVATAATETG